jgi:hypothetical protein
MRKDNLARSRALTRLAQRFPKVFKALLNEEREKEGLPPVGILHRGPQAKEVFPNFKKGVKP